MSEGKSRSFDRPRVRLHRRQVRRHFPFVLILAALLVGCLLNATHNLPDGTACNNSGDCKSGGCIANVCEGSKCSCPGGACDLRGTESSDCASGWLCVHAGVFVTDFDRCQPLCSAPCPSNWVCPLGGTLCSFNPSMGALRVAVKGPTTPISINEMIRFHADVTTEGGAPVAAVVTWTFGDGQGVVGFDAAHSYAAAGRYEVTAVADDGHGKTGQGTSTVTVQ